MPPATLDYVPERPRPRIAQELHPGRRGHRPRHHRPVFRRGRPRRRGRGASPGGYLVITCSSDRDRRARDIRTCACCGRCAPPPSSSPAAGWTIRSLNAEMRRHVAAMRALRRRRRPPVATCLGRGRGRRGQRGRHRQRWSRRSSGSVIAQIAFLAGPTSLFVARQRLAGYRRGLAEAGIAFDERLVVSTGFNREGGALGIDRLLAGDGAVHRGLRGQRPAGARARCGGWRSSGSRSRATSRSRASTTSRRRR